MHHWLYEIGHPFLRLSLPLDSWCWINLFSYSFQLLLLSYKIYYFVRSSCLLIWEILISHGDHAPESFNKGLNTGSVTFYSCYPQTHTMRANIGIYLTFFFLGKIVNRTKSANLHLWPCKSHCVSTTSAPTASIFLHALSCPTTLDEKDSDAWHTAFKDC